MHNCAYTLTLYLRPSLLAGADNITLKPSSDSNFRRISVIFDLAPVTSEQQERSVAADLMEISSLYGSHRAALIA